MEVRTYQIGMREYSTESAARQLQEREAVRPAAVSAKRKKKTGKRHVSRSLTMRGYAVFFAAACLVTMILLNQYLMLQSSVRRHTRAVSGLRMQLESVKRENDDLEERIDSAVNLANVYDYAVRELGLVPIKANQVLVYDRAEREYVMQQEDIPQF